MKLLLLDRRATLADCELHQYHSPVQTYNETHHVVPRAWQMFWQPPAPIVPGSYDGQHLWDARTTTICRTGHGNVHFWIVALTEAWEVGANLSEVVERVRRAHGWGGGREELATARLALTRFMQAGGSVDELVASRLWGQI